MLAEQAIAYLEREPAFLTSEPNTDDEVGTRGTEISIAALPEAEQLAIRRLLTK